MREINNFTNIKLSLSLFFVILMCFIPSCSEDTPVTTTNQNTGGVNSTPIGNPNGPPVTASVGPSGGNIIAADSTFELSIPPGALSTNTQITVQSVENFCFNGHGNAFRLTPESQQFSQPVTIKFYYSEEVLQSTYDILMGIARQDANGHWHYFNDINNDTLNHVISASISQFGSHGDNNTGGGDISFFDIAHLEPRSGNVSVSNTLGLSVVYEALPGTDGELTYLPRPIGSWWVNGIQNGNNTVGTIINRLGQGATYKAPAQVPSPDVVLAGALVNTGINYRGRVIETYLLQSRIKITSNIYRFHLKINELADWSSSSGYPCFLSDGVDMDITVDNTASTVNASSILNRFPNVAPPSGTYPDGSTVTWIAGTDVGHVNVTGITGFMFELNGRKYFSLTFNHTSTKNPLFHVVPQSGPDYWLGGEPVAGFPGSVTFVNKDSNQTVIPTGFEWGFSAILTVIP